MTTRKTKKQPIPGTEYYSEPNPPCATPPTNEQVDNPSHYHRFAIEPTRFIVENLGPSWFVGNIVKYILRYDAKNGLQDLKKARRYLDMMIARFEDDEDWWRLPSR